MTTKEEAEYLAFLRTTAETVDKMFSGTVRMEGKATVRVDPQKVRDLFRQSVRQFAVWWKLYHRAAKIDCPDVDAETAEPPNPIDWPTPAGRRAFAGEKQMACYVATLCAIHDANKNPCVELRSWRTVLRALLYDLIRKRDRQAGYDQSVVAETLRQVKEHMVCECARQPLSLGAARIFEKLCTLKTHEAMTGPAIQRWYEDETRTNLDEGTWKRWRLELLAWGMKNRPKVGYYIEQK